MSWLGPVLGFVGGMMDRADRAKDAKANTPKALRAALEEAGYNPLLMPNIAGTQGAGYAPQMGSNMNALASTLAFSDSEQNALKLRATEMEQENEFLQRQLQRQTLTPDVPGIYDAGETSEQGYGNGTPDIPFDRNYPSPDLFSISGTGPDRFHRNEAPIGTMFGLDFYGSGAISSGGTFEEMLGDGPMNWMLAPFIVADAVGHTVGKLQQERQGDQWFERELERQREMEKNARRLGPSTRPVRNPRRNYDPWFPFFPQSLPN